MRQVDVRDAQAHLTRLVDEVASGKTVVITRDGSPVARLESVDLPPGRARNLVGFLSGRLSTPVDFDRMGEAELANQFGGSDN